MFTQIKKRSIEYVVLYELFGRDKILYDLYIYSETTHDTFTILKKEANMSLDIEMEHTSARKLVINLSFNERESNKETRILPDKQDRT